MNGLFVLDPATPIDTTDLLTTSTSLVLSSPSPPSQLLQRDYSTTSTMNAYTNSNNALSSLDKQLRRFNETQQAEEDRTQSFLSKVNAHIITTHLIAPDAGSLTKSVGGMSSFGKQQQHQQQNGVVTSQQATFSSSRNNSEGFFLHSNVYFKSKCDFLVSLL